MFCLAIKRSYVRTSDPVIMTGVWTHMLADSVWPSPSYCVPVCLTDLGRPVVPLCQQPRYRYTPLLGPDDWSVVPTPDGPGPSVPTPLSGFL